MDSDDDITDRDISVHDTSEDATRCAVLATTVKKVTGQISRQVQDCVAIEEPLEIQLGYGPAGLRQIKSISVTMRTPGYDFDLAAGFLLTEGVVRDVNDIEHIAYAIRPFGEARQNPQIDSVLPASSTRNAVRCGLAADVPVNTGLFNATFIRPRAAAYVAKRLCSPCRQSARRG